MLTLKEIQKVMSIYNKVVVDGSYSRVDIESIELLVPNSIESEAVSVKEIPSGSNSDVQRNALIQRFYMLKESIDEMLYDHANNAIDRMGPLVIMLLDINKILIATMDSKIEPVDYIDSIIIRCAEYSSVELSGTDNTINLYADSLTRLSELIHSSNDPKINKSIAELKFRIDVYMGDDYMPADNEWSGYILKSLLGVDKITYSVIHSLLSNPKVLIDKIEDMVNNIVDKTAQYKQFSLNGSSYGYDASINSVVNLEYMGMQDPLILGFMNDRISLPIIVLYSLALMKNLKINR